MKRTTDVAAVLGGILALLFSAVTAWSPVENDGTIGALDAELQTLARILPRAGASRTWNTPPGPLMPT